MRRSGLTIVELLIAIAIIGLLLALLFPAVQAARESSRRTKCANNIRQIALALHQYEDAHGVLPVSAFNNYSFHTYLLPYIEQESLYRKFDLEINAMDYEGPLRAVRVATYECPSDSSRFADDGVTLARGNYHGNSGSGAQRYGFNGVFGYGQHPLGTTYWIPLVAISDGLSQTAMVAEITGTLRGSTDRRRAIWSLMGSAPASQYEAFASECLAAPDTAPASLRVRGWPWLESGAAAVVYNHILPPNAPCCASSSSPKHSIFTSQSFHASGVNMACADGSVQLVDDSIDVNVWRQFGSRDGRP